MSWSFTRLASSKEDMKALIQEQVDSSGFNLRQDVADLLKSNIDKLSTLPAGALLSLETNGHIDGSYFHISKAEIKMLVPSSPKPPPPPPEPAPAADQGATAGQGSTAGQAS